MAQGQQGQLTAGMRMPATPAIAQRPFCSSALRYLQRGRQEEQSVPSTGVVHEVLGSTVLATCLPGCGAACPAAWCCR